MSNNSLTFKLMVFLYDMPNIIGSLLGIVGLALFFLGVIGTSALWLPIVAGLYLIGFIATPASRNYHLRLRQEYSIEEVRKSLDDLMAEIAPKVAPEIYAKVASIKDSIESLLPMIADVNNSGDRNIFTIRQTALDYLPETLSKYLSLPTAYARFHPVQNGKTPKQILLEQLDILDQKMREIVQAFHEGNTQDLLANGRFLEEKFLDRSYLSAADSQVPPPPPSP